jgi:hypothetical protein
MTGLARISCHNEFSGLTDIQAIVPPPPSTTAEPTTLTLAGVAAFGIALAKGRLGSRAIRPTPRGACRAGRALPSACLDATPFAFAQSVPTGNSPEHSSI